MENIEAFEIKAVDIYVDSLKSLQSASVTIFTGILAYLGAIYQYSGGQGSRTVWIIAALGLFFANIISIFVAVSYLIGPLSVGEIPIHELKYRLIFGWCVSCFLAALACSAVFFLYLYIH